MSLLLLTNTLGAQATSFSYNGTAADANYDYKDLAGGPRSNGAVTTTRASHNWQYRSTATMSWDFSVVTRADRIANGKDSYRLSLNDTTTSGGASGYSSVESTDPFTTSSLVGMRIDGKSYGQDYVYLNGSTRTGKYGVELDIDDGGGAYATQAIHLANWIVGESFTFGTEPTLRKNRVQMLPSDDQGIVRPIFGYHYYKTTHRLTLNWQHVTQAKMAAFRALPLNLPLFLYDEDGDIFEHKLEHVVLAQPWNEIRVEPDLYSLEITFHRLEHYK